MLYHDRKNNVQTASNVQPTQCCTLSSHNCWSYSVWNIWVLFLIPLTFKPAFQRGKWREFGQVSVLCKQRRRSPKEAPLCDWTPQYCYAGHQIWHSLHKLPTQISPLSYSPSSPSPSNVSKMKMQLLSSSCTLTYQYLWYFKGHWMARGCTLSSSCKLIHRLVIVYQIAMVAAIWGQLWCSKSITFFCDNTATVEVLNKYLQDHHLSCNLCVNLY